jgi:hypothetical protein
MNKRPGQLNVVTEVSYCPFCERPRNLRREERHLGALVRMTLTCETCHRTLESTMTVAGAEKPAAKPAPAQRAEPAAEKPAPALKSVAAKAKTPTRASARKKATATATTRRATKGK